MGAWRLEAVINVKHIACLAVLEEIPLFFNKKSKSIFILFQFQ
jgi:hypothetical protein